MGRIRLHASEVVVQRNTELVLSGVRDARITREHLKALSSVGDHAARNIGEHRRPRLRTASLTDSKF